MKQLQFCLYFVVMPLAECGMPGAFFWKPRIDIDMGWPSNVSRQIHKPLVENIEKGVVVLIESFQLGMTAMALAESISDEEQYPEMDPLRGYFYTNAYRWAKRHLSMFPHWLAKHGKYPQTHKVWKKRFYYMNDFMPSWMTKLLPFVNKEDWVNERHEFRRFQKFAEPAFYKHYEYPRQVPPDIKSEESSASSKKSSKSSSFDSTSKN